jgi:hypothetical protein
MRHINILLILFIIVSLDSCQAQDKLKYPEFFIEKVDSVPDLSMTDKALELPDGGGYFCGPVSIASSLIYLKKNGFEKLLPDYQGDTMRIYRDLICQLSEDKYMRTIPNKITPPGYMIRGLKKYVKDSGYDFDKIEYKEFGKDENYDIDLLKNRISNGYESIIFLWITKEIEPNVMKIIAGHWVSLVGYGKDEKGNTNSDILIIQDPGSGFIYNANDCVELKLCDSDFKADKQNFKNHYELMDFDCTNGADKIFLSGLLSFRLKK